MVTIPLRDRTGKVIAEALVSDEDRDAVERYRWSLHGAGYAVRVARIDGKSYTILLHRQIVGLRPGDGLQVDHIDRDRLNCQRDNLRIADDFYNRQNFTCRGATSAHRGVSWHKQRGKWTAHCGLNGKQHHLGLFESEEEAARVAAAFRREHLPYATE